MNRLPLKEVLRHVIAQCSPMRCNRAFNEKIRVNSSAPHQLSYVEFTL